MSEFLSSAIPGCWLTVTVSKFWHHQLCCLQFLQLCQLFEDPPTAAHCYCLDGGVGEVGREKSSWLLSTLFFWTHMDDISALKKYSCVKKTTVEEKIHFSQLKYVVALFQVELLIIDFIFATKLLHFYHFFWFVCVGIGGDFIHQSLSILCSVSLPAPSWLHHCTLLPNQSVTMVFE